MPIVHNSVKIGTKLRFLRNTGDGDTLDTEPGRIYVIAGYDHDSDMYYYDDAGEKNFAATEDGDGIFEIVG